MGDDKTYCFLKAPEGFHKQVGDVANIFMQRAHKRLMDKVERPNRLFEQVFSQTTQSQLEKNFLEMKKENEKINARSNRILDEDFKAECPKCNQSYN